MKSITFKIIITVVLCLSADSFSVYASEEVTIPHEFKDGDVTSADQMNENFRALAKGINDNRALVAELVAESTVVFQGFTESTFDGAEGLLAMQEACYNLSEGSHICTNSEIAESSYNPNAENLHKNETAWVTSGPQADANTPVLEHSCDGWKSRNANYMGTVVNDSFQFSDSVCSTHNRVACCK